MPEILEGTVMHKRLFPKVNAFSYGIYYMALPLSKLSQLPIAHNRFAAMSFHYKDHGACDGTSLQTWAEKILNEYNLHEANGEITLICMPRILGYVFNPVSFWLCRDKNKNVRAILCEVHNTFGEKHTYICAHEDHRPIIQTDTLIAEKIFHVSPFIEREGHYKFKFKVEDDSFGAWIDLYDSNGDKKLITSLIGKFIPASKSNFRHVFWSYPLVTLKAISLIHWQALKIVLKGIKYISKPIQNKTKVSITKMSFNRNDQVTQEQVR